MHKTMMAVARGMAMVGGAVLSLLIVLTCISIAGRSLNGILHSDFMMSVAPGLARWLIDLGIGPVNGDFELVEAGVAFAIFAFIPLCQITGGHASVDIFTDMMPPVVTRVLRVIIDIVFAAVLILIAWRLYEGMLSKQSYGETSFLLQFPVWWAYAASLFGAVVSSIVAVYVAAMRIIEFFTGTVILPDGAEAG